MSDKKQYKSYLTLVTTDGCMPRERNALASQGVDMHSEVSLKHQTQQMSLSRLAAAPNWALTSLFETKYRPVQSHETCSNVEHNKIN